MTIAVYRITNRLNGRFYIGSSKRCERRFNEHRSALERGKHHCRALQNSWRSHGAESFAFEIVQECATWDEALEAEQAMLTAYVGQRDCLNGSARARMPILDPVVMARSRATANASERYIESHRAVCVRRNADRSFQIRAAEAMRGSARHKDAVRRNAMLLQRSEVVAKNRAALRNSVTQKDAARRQAAALNTPEMKAKNIAITSRPVIGVSTSDGSIVRFQSQSAAAREFDVYSSNISMCCAGKLKSVRGYRWAYDAPAGRAA